MKKISKKLTVAILSVAFAFVALGATTFAWFTLTNEVTVGQFQGQVTAGTGFEVSIDDDINGYTGVKNYYSHLPEAIIEAALVKLGKSITAQYFLTDLTSSDGITFNNLKGSSLSTGYIEFDLKFRSTQKGAAIYLGKSTKINRLTGISWTADKAFTGTHGAVASGDTGTYYAADAVRVSIVEKNATSGAIVYENPGEVNGNTVLAQSAVAVGSISYYAAKTGVNLLENDDYSTQTSIMKSVTSGLAVDDEQGNDYFIIKLASSQAVDGFYYGIVTVRVWIEGWDPDCFNAILKDKFSVELHFVSLESTPEDED